ncbi:MAG: TonB-dependent receptor [Desulfobacteraceae bacterium]|nr:TonB-dependent receptor [Desulfobacteraceae bacterium]
MDKTLVSRCKLIRIPRLPGCFKKRAGIVCVLIFIILAAPALCGIGTAGAEEDMEVLRMFFEEEDLFTSVTRTPKPISQIAENVTIVTAKEIRKMNARTVAEVLNRIPGMFVNFSQGIGTPGSTSLLHVQGSEDMHVLVLVDGVPWNSMAGGTAETNNIPIGMIERIEVIKGPASSSWGSALGGVVHIITKSPGYASGPHGSVQVSYGENTTMDHRAEASGRSGRLGYYLYAGRQDSQGPDDARYFEKHSLFSKFSYTASSRVRLGASLGYSRPDTGLGDYEPSDIISQGSDRNLWVNATADATISRELSFNLSLFRLEQKSTITSRALGLGYVGEEGELFQKSIYDEAATGGTAKLVWSSGVHTAVLGADYSSGKLDQTIFSGRFPQNYFGAPARLHTDPDIEKTGVYLNDTIALDKVSVTPGIRYDYSSITGSFLSPSLGAACRAGKETILRGSVARGFTSPPLSWTSGGALFLDPNPSLEEETAWSFQAGLESAALPHVWVKTSLFRHEIDDVFERETTADGDAMFVNKGESRRQGAEIEIETLPFYHTSFRAGAAYVNIDPENDYGAQDMYMFNIGAVYDNPALLRAELFGHYINWDAASEYSSEDGIIWNINASRLIYADENIKIELFLTGRNIFNQDQYLVAENKNPGRWFGGGFRLNF